jgi:1-acyl-sn-glycerol-3-phosphate acyltransferase
MAANHVGWWDGPCMMLVDEALGAEGAFVLQASSLVRYPYFRWLGAIPLPSSPLAMRSAFRAAKAQLTGPGKTVWFFPQGRERPSWVRPLGLHRGHEVLARSAPLLPVSIAYAWRDGPLPAACIHVGDAVDPARLEPAIVDGLARIERFFDDRVGDFVPLVPRA